MSEPALLDPSPVADPPSTGRRGLTARGTLINSLFAAFLGFLNFARALIVAALLTASEFGVWTIIFVTLVLLIAVKSSLVSDKYIQQSEPDQVKAFQKAFTLDLASSVVLALVMLVLAPLIGLMYGRGELVAPTLVIALMIPGLSLQMPIWIFYRRMQFVRQRVLQAVDPLVAIAVTVSLIVAGMGYWGLVIGTVAGAWAGGIIAVINCPIPLRLRFERETLRHYVSFSGPLLIAMLSAMVMAQASVISAEAALGLAGAGAIGLAATFREYTSRLEYLLNQTMYPAVCRVVDRAELLFEVSVKSNRLSMMWGVPFGIGVALFIPDLVEFLLGPSWQDAVIVLQAFGLAAALDQIGLNWSVFYRAVGRTRPIAIVAVWAMIAFLLTGVPLLLTVGLGGYAIGIGAATVVSLLLRAHYLRLLFPRMHLGRHALRALGPVAPAVGVVFAARALESGERTAGVAIAEMAVFVLVTALITLIAERRLLSEVWGYVRGRSPGIALSGPPDATVERV